MSDFTNDLSERFLDSSVTLLSLEKGLCRTYSGRHIYHQLFKAGTSWGANYEEARAGESRAYFIQNCK